MLTSDNSCIGSPCVTALCSTFAYHLEFNKLNGPVPTLTIKRPINIVILPVLTERYGNGWQVWLHYQRPFNRLIDCFFFCVCVVIYLTRPARKWHQSISCIFCPFVTSISSRMTRERDQKLLPLSSAWTPNLFVPKMIFKPACLCSPATLNNKSLAAVGRGATQGPRRTMQDRLEIKSVCYLSVF